MEKKKKKLVMVDLDGTLIDTAEANWLAYRKALNEFGYDISLETYAERCDGRPYRDFLPEILGEGAGCMEAVHERKKGYYPGFLGHAKVNRHLVSILEALRGEYFTALVTTASRANVERVLSFFALEDLFDRVVTQEDMERCKPDPDCYIRTMEYFHVEKEDTVIFEDSETGVKAAEASGCGVYVFRKALPGRGAL